ncbi:MAG: AAA family ATPase [Oligoflexia bacterium]|nr:AAA family ATPase [Oligoflexia bacterium]
MAKLSPSNSFFILGPRGSGKSTLIKQKYSKNSLYIDFLDPQIEDRYRLSPSALKQELAGQPQLKRVIIDEVQKLPRILDVAHQLIEEKNIQFILSGSSARKLKRGGANLLAGRAFIFYLHPFTSLELGPQFNLNEALCWGLLPRQFNLKNNGDKEEYLKAYALTYLKEEIQMEQIVRKLRPFRKFLEVAAQMNAKVINYSKIARDIGVDTSTVQNYYSILEETLVGFYLRPYHTSIRKSQRLSPKFYLFDTGVCRALKGTLHIPLLPQTYDFGEAFEHFIILEIIKLAEYNRKNWKYFYLLTKDGAEIDLIIDRPGETTLCIKIKSSARVTESDVRNLIQLGADIPKSNLYCFSRDTVRKRIQNVLCLEWQKGISEIFQKDGKRSFK